MSKVVHCNECGEFPDYCYCNHEQGCPDCSDVDCPGCEFDCKGCGRAYEECFCDLARDESKVRGAKQEQGVLL